MSSLTGRTLADVGVDAAAVKPAVMAVERAAALSVPSVIVDYEGHEHLPSSDTLRSLADRKAVRVTVPVRADGFDPLGEDGRLRALPDGVATALVAGHPAYLSASEQARAVAPRFRAAAERLSDPWVGTESVARIALATGRPQFELLSGTTESDVGTLRAAGFDGRFAVYAPTVLSDDPDAILDAVGAYAARRPVVAEQLPEGTPTDGAARGAVRETLLAACREYALVGTPATIRERLAGLRSAGVDTVVGYPARGLDAVLE